MLALNKDLADKNICRFLRFLILVALIFIYCFFTPCVDQNARVWHWERICHKQPFYCNYMFGQPSTWREDGESGQLTKILSRQQPTTNHTPTSGPTRSWPSSSQTVPLPWRSMIGPPHEGNCFQISNSQETTLWRDGPMYPNRLLRETSASLLAKLIPKQEKQTLLPN